MKVRRWVAMPLVSMMLAQGGAGQALAYTQASDVVFNQRTPFATQATLDSDYRLRGMGGLDLPVMDDSNKVGTFKYGQAPAGLPQDYDQSKAELGLFGEGGTSKDKGTNDDAFTGDVADVSQSVLHGMLALRTGNTPESHGAFAVGLILEGDEADATSGFKAANNLSSLKNEPGLGVLQLGYGHQLGRLLLGFGIQSVGATSFDQKYTTTSNISVHAKDEETFLDVVPSVGYAAPMPNGTLTFTLSPRFRSTEDKFTINGFEDKSEEDGTLIDAGVHYGNAGAIQTAFYITAGSLDGDLTSNGAAAGKSNTDETDFRFRLYSHPEQSRFSFGVVAEQLNTESDSKNQAGVKNGDFETTDTTLGAGTAFHFQEGKGLVGVDLKLLTVEDQDNLNSDNDEKSNGYQVALGGEYAIRPKLWLRAGVNVKSLDVEPHEMPTLNVTTTEVTLGAEYKFSDRSSLALNLSSVGIGSEGSSEAGVDKEEYGGGSLQLLGKMYFGESAAKQE